MSRRIPPLIAALVPALMLSPHLWEGSIPFFCDSVTQAYPYHLHFAREVAEGTMPLFNPFQLGGTSFIGNVQASVAYPLRWLAAGLGAPRGFVALLALHLALAGLGCYKLARRLGSGPAGASLSGLCFSLGGFIFGKIALPPILITAAYAPWVLLFTLGVLDGRRGWPLALSVGLMLASGHPQTALIVLLAAAGLAVFELAPWRLAFREDHPRWRRSWIVGVGLFVSAYVSGFFTLASFGQGRLHPLRPTIWVVLLAGLSLAAVLAGAVRTVRGRLSGRVAARLSGWLFLGAWLAAAQLLPVVEHLSESRPPRRPDRIERWAALSDRVALFVDAVLGHERDAEVSLHLGPVGLALAVLALAAGRNRRCAALGFTALGFYVVASGPAALRGVLLSVPLVNLFPGLGRYLLVPALALAVLAGLGMHHLWVRLSRPAAMVIWGLAVLPLLGGASAFLVRRTPADLYPPSPLHAGLGELERFVSLDRAPPLFGLDYRREEMAALMMPNLGIVHRREDLQGYDPVRTRAVDLLLRAMGPAQFPRGDDYHFGLAGTSEPGLLDLAGVRHLLVHRDRGSRGRRLRARRRGRRRPAVGGCRCPSPGIHPGARRGRGRPPACPGESGRRGWRSVGTGRGSRARPADLRPRAAPPGPTPSHHAARGGSGAGWASRGFRALLRRVGGAGGRRALAAGPGRRGPAGAAVESTGEAGGAPVRAPGVSPGSVPQPDGVGLVAGPRFQRVVERGGDAPRLP